MTHDLNALAYPNGRTGTDYVFPYQFCYYGESDHITCLHEWKQRQIELLETFRRRCMSMEVKGEGANKIDCDNMKQMFFFKEQRNIIKQYFREKDMHIETINGLIRDEQNKRFIVETMSFAGKYRLFAKVNL